MSASGQHENGTILMVFMFRGNYLREKLGHEIINLFMADNKKHYIYVNPWGHVNEKDHGKIETILLVRYVGNRKVKIIAKAWNLSDSYSGVKGRHSRKERTPQDLLEIKKRQMKDCEEIKYGGKKLADIFNYAEENDKQGILVSYEAGDFRRAKDGLYVDFSKKEEKGNPACHSLKGYYPSPDEKNINSENKNPKEKVYDELKKKINDNNLWEEGDNSEIIEKGKNGAIKKQFNILNVIGKEDDELAFSNWFSYLLNKNPAMLKDFARRVLNCELSSQAYVLREEKNIDLLIVDPGTNSLVVIENKIKSGINGAKKKQEDLPTTQMNDSNTELNSEKTNNYNQLDKYKENANKIAKDIGFPDGTHPKFYAFLPNYNKKEEGTYKSKGYEVVWYKEIRNSFSCILAQKRDDLKYLDLDGSFDLFVLNEFVKALARHESEFPDHLFEDTYSLFVETISKTK